MHSINRLIIITIILQLCSLSLLAREHHSIDEQVMHSVTPDSIIKNSWHKTIFFSLSALATYSLTFFALDQHCHIFKPAINRVVIAITALYPALASGYCAITFFDKRNALEEKLNNQQLTDNDLCLTPPIPIYLIDNKPTHPNHYQNNDDE